MKYCFNHPEKKAFSICRGCGKDYCEVCLVEGTEYYFCKNPECQKILDDEISGKNEILIKLPEIVLCPACESELELSEDERNESKVHCPECEAFIDFNNNPPKILLKANYIELLSSLNQGDIALIKSMLDDAKIFYYVVGENFLAIRPLLEPARFFVNEQQLKEAADLLKDFKLNIWGVSTNRYK
jgi:uncharacterized protein YbaR (Trm112 family)